MTTAEVRRLEVLRRIHDVVYDRLYDNVSTSRSVKPEVTKRVKEGLIEPCDRDGEPGYRRTEAGDEALEATR